MKKLIIFTCLISLIKFSFSQNNQNNVSSKVIFDNYHKDVFLTIKYERLFTTKKKIGLYTTIGKALYDNSNSSYTNPAIAQIGLNTFLGQQNNFFIGFDFTYMRQHLKKGYIGGTHEDEKYIKSYFDDLKANIQCGYVLRKKSFYISPSIGYGYYLFHRHTVKYELSNGEPQKDFSNTKEDYFPAENINITLEVGFNF